jgi:hypothetical protein
MDATKVVRSRLVQLWCVECGRPSGPEAKSWRLYRTDDEAEPVGEVTALAAVLPGLRGPGVRGRAGWTRRNGLGVGRDLK